MKRKGIVEEIYDTKIKDLERHNATLSQELNELKTKKFMEFMNKYIKYIEFIDNRTNEPIEQLKNGSLSTEEYTEKTYYGWTFHKKYVVVNFREGYSLVFSEGI